ncbi:MULTISPECIES: MarR family transcriptional regulator [unclassified Paenibacillus]|uniref:MarR family winged helix-turn-helix transcriptional regulator n=1 Tax=unclassified Paenibacillus TaxID=185978 RepID=UPI002404FA0C|nr:MULTISPECIES: MarR family transcriptional regulator [unclassified Paenibacillus]MDF9842959.1 DNA-binding MarR family transcriptional regulator [Paenibacillus sp. PastF-2]MDF9849547.1 DNA-binding MarR family transcriptional regulator [Paenibacillus sp. PastM-2]MDF9856078.1 DNA-binding MarR family transcriptional regulator [Paenibacillus sp. PastF-1]MDH6481390.1 DNA-binding MarR family transcriptional regulator [Paenibacillus sp. PastH-2]MDH6508767.1 DNA-binding MarR family transcriptional re
MNEEAEHWITRYVDAYLIVTRQISARIKERIAEGLTTDQFLILRLIKAQEQCTSTYLAESVCVGKSSITAIINRLDEAGMIERTRDENDRRLVYLSLTEQGEEVYQLAEKQVKDVISPYLLHFEEDDIEKFITMFEKLAFLMQETGGRNE